MRIIKEYKNYIIYTIITIAVIYFIYFSYNMYIQTRTTKRALNTNLITLRQKDLEEETLLYQKNQYNSKVEALYNTLISQNSITDWVNQENAIASLSNVAAEISFGSATVYSKSIQIGTGTSSATAGKTLSVSLNLVGSFAGILAYIRMLENSYYFSNINLVNLTSQKGGASNRLNATVTLYLYIQ